MALPDLASAGDLLARKAPDDYTYLLPAASSIVRGAAGSPIVETTSTVTITAWGDRALSLPGQPVRSVSTVLVDGVVVTDWLLTDSGTLWRRCGWGHEDCPTNVAVTMVHGLPEAPASIVNLVCDLVIAGGQSAADGGLDPRVVAEKVDDYSVEYARGAEAVAGAMELPELTRRRLRAQFGNSVGVVWSR